MARWKYELDLRDVWTKPETAPGFTYKDLAEEVVKRIKKLSCYFSDAKLQNICMEFEYFDEEGDADDFDFLMGDLYDWGDGKNAEGSNRCWIKTEF